MHHVLSQIFCDFIFKLRMLRSVYTYVQFFSLCLLFLFIVIRITDRMGPKVILSIIHAVTIDTMPNNNGGNNGHGLKAIRVNRPLINENDIIQNQTWAESDHSSSQSKRYREAFPDIDHPVVQLVRSTVIRN